MYNNHKYIGYIEKPNILIIVCVFMFAINRSSNGQNKESELLIAATVLQAASWLLREPHPRIIIMNINDNSNTSNNSNNEYISA